ncbi:MAG: hypothetical protein QNJ58_25935 [Desulfobacterales bacterium]|nr:hypothetical protein [Desulfobacterales bacterium]
MALIKEDFEKETLEAWRTYTAALEKSLEKLEQDINEASEMSDVCTGEWCKATEHVIDELGNALFMISEPRWSEESDSKKIKSLKRRLHELYSKYKGVSSSS